MGSSRESSSRYLASSASVPSFSSSGSRSPAPSIYSELASSSLSPPRAVRPPSGAALPNRSRGLELSPSSASNRSTASRRGSALPPLNNPSAATTSPPPLPNRACEVCEKADKTTYFCAYCDGNFCDECWAKERPHKQGKLAPDGLPHEKADPQVVNRLKRTFSPPSDPQVQDRLHAEDDDTTWFGIARDLAGVPIFQDYGRYATLMANSATGEHVTRYPQLVSFIGQTGAGKSTLIKMLIEQQSGSSGKVDSQPFPSPIVGSVRNDNTPTSGDVHLYADPSTYLGPLPLLYADCEGLEGGENSPVGVRHREADSGSSSRKRAGSSPDRDRNRLKKKWKISRGTQRDIAWATSPETQKRQYAVTELYPRLLYTFSDVIVFVLQNPKTFESAVLSKLLGWASASMEKSLNQPTLPHAIIALNATDMGVDQKEWDVDLATEILMSNVAGAIGREPKYREYAEYWTSKGKIVRTMKDLLECYYSSVRVVRIPRKGRYMLIDEQVSKLHHEISNSCTKSYYAKRKARMLSTADELHVYLQSAFDHFSQNLDTPFNFIEVAFKNNPIPLDFGGDILKLAVAIRDTGKCLDGVKIFRELSEIVASCIMLDCSRNDLHGPMEQLLEKYYIDFCDYALEDFCGLFWPCTFESRSGRCVNVQEGHTKGHQNARGRILGSGPYESDFTWDTFKDEWLELLESAVRRQHALLNEGFHEKHPRESEKTLARDLHRRNMNEFYPRLGAHNFKSHATCFCCLREPPEHPLPCGHVLCTPCVSAYGKPKRGSIIQMDNCPLHALETPFHQPWLIKFKPPLAGVRILCLDGGGIRGIVELEVLHEIEQYIGGRIPIQNFFDLIVGTSTGGIIALGLGVEHWRVEACITKFLRLANKAFTPRIPVPGMRIGSKYRTAPLEEALKEVFRNEALFGGQHEDSSSYYTKVAVTSATDTGDQPVILTNYNRQLETQPMYNFVRPDKPRHELKIWEAGRATSAAPTFFKPFVNERTHEGYLDGALFHNNPVKVAYHESKLLWRDAEALHPDILLSIGTSHNGEDSIGFAEQSIQRRPRRRQRPSSDVISPEKDRRVNVGSWFKNNAFVHFLNILVNRVDNILNAEQIWLNFRTEILDTAAEEESRRRYERFNPHLGYRPPRLDEKHKMEELRSAVVGKLRNAPQYKKKIARVAHQLIASSFYYDKTRETNEGESGWTLTGRIRCRFPNGSPELRDLGSFLRLQQQTKFQPFFRIQEKNREVFAVSKVLTVDKVEDMITRSNFDMGSIEIHISDKLGDTTIALGLMDRFTQKEEVIPISGFPRCLIQEAPSKVSIPEQNQDRPKLRGRRSIRRVRSPLATNDANRLSTGRLSDHTRSNSGSSSLSTQSFPFSSAPGDVNDWISRRAAAATIVRSSAPPPDPQSPLGTSSGPSSRGTPSGPTSPGPIPQAFAAAVESVFELPATVDIDEDEDERMLRQAIALSLRDTGGVASNSSRYTVGGTNMDELAEVLQLSTMDR